jgi:hypothetical protein
VRVPNGAFYARFVRDASGKASAPGPLARLLLAHNNLLGFPYRHGFTPSSLTRLVQDCGFEVIRVRGDALVPTADRWTRSWARIEERIVKSPALRWLAPWFEIYARRQ